MKTQPGDLQFLVMCHPGCHGAASNLSSMAHFSPHTGCLEQRFDPYVGGDSG